jgi:putative transposase
MKQAISLEKVAAALKQEELGVPLEDIIQEMGISRETYLDWRQGHVATTDLEKMLERDEEESAPEAGLKAGPDAKPEPKPETKPETKPESPGPDDET